jgi:hypothetical protein
VAAAGDRHHDHVGVGVFEDLEARRLLSGDAERRVAVDHGDACLGPGVERRAVQPAVVPVDPEDRRVVARDRREALRGHVRGDTDDGGEPFARGVCRDRPGHVAVRDSRHGADAAGERARHTDRGPPVFERPRRVCALELHPDRRAADGVVEPRCTHERRPAHRGAEAGRRVDGQEVAVAPERGVGGRGPPVGFALGRPQWFATVTARAVAGRAAGVTDPSGHGSASRSGGKNLPGDTGAPGGKHYYVDE